jgi:hypothetical protein
MLRGFLGASSEEGCVRLYFDNQFSDYVEVPEAASVHTEDVPKEWSPFGAVYMWIERDAEVTHGAVEQARATVSGVAELQCVHRISPRSGAGLELERELLDILTAVAQCLK